MTYDLDLQTYPRYHQGTRLHQILGPYLKRFSQESADRRTHTQTHRCTDTQTGLILYPRPLTPEGTSIKCLVNWYLFCTYKCVNLWSRILHSQHASYKHWFLFFPGVGFVYIDEVYWIRGEQSIEQNKKKAYFIPSFHVWGKLAYFSINPLDIFQHLHKCQKWNTLFLFYWSFDNNPLWYNFHDVFPCSDMIKLPFTCFNHDTNPRNNEFNGW